LQFSFAMPERSSGQTNQRTIVLVAVALVLVAVLVVGLAWNSFNPKSTESETSNQTVPTTASTTTSTPVDTSTWLLYSNTKYGYEIKYPPTGYSGMVDIPGAGPIANSPTADEADFYLSTSPAAFDNAITINVATRPNVGCYLAADLADKITCYRSRFGPGLDFIGVKEVDFAGARVFQADYCNTSWSTKEVCDQKTGFKNRIMTVKHAGLYYDFGIHFVGAEPARDISTMLDTFRFTK